MDYRSKINEKVHELIVSEKIGENLYRANCLKDKTHYMYIKDHLLSCPVCGYSQDLVSLSADIIGTSEDDMIKRIYKKKFNEIIEIPESFEHEMIKDANYEAMVFYQKNLKNTPKALKYLKERGLKEETIEKFKIGYAPGYNRLLKTFTDEFGLETLVEAGLVDYSQRTGKHYDVFRERIIFPIFDTSGETVLGFGGRTIGDSDIKYINTKTTPIFEKSKELFGFEHVSVLGSVLVSEGYLDVITMHQNGITNAVGTLGTALSIYNHKRLKKTFDEVIMIYDGDEAGIKAAERTIEKIGDANLLILPDNMDPDDFIRKKGRSTFLDYIKKEKIDPITYWMNQYTNHKGNVFEFIEKHIKTSL